MRRNDWPAKLSESLAAARAEGFSRGTLDCCLFSADVVEAMTGVDYAADFRGTYTDRKGAAAALKKFGSGNIRQTVTKIMGPEIDMLRVGRGDLVLANQGKGNMLGICVGETAAFLTRGGLVFLRLTYCRTAWRVE